MTWAFFLALFKRYGYVAVGGGVMLENAGVPLPGETILLVASALAAQGHLSFPFVLISAALGAVLGDNFGYWLGYEGGRNLLNRFGRYIFLSPTRLGYVERYYAKHGPLTVFIARFIAGLRVFGALFAGVSRMPYRLFFTYNFLGAICWAGAIGGLGYAFGTQWRRLETILHRADAALLAGALIAGAVLVWRRLTGGGRRPA